ncbi:MAG: TIGR01777 family oxidoreductase [Bacteroidota bacterium]
MKVLITGATGLVGRALVEELKDKNIPVHYLTTSRAKIVSKTGYQGYYWDPSSGEIDPAAFEGVTAIINLAGATISKRWTSSYKKIVLDSRLDSLKTLYRGLVAFGPERISSFVSASAIGIYPHSYTTFYAEGETAVDDSFLGEVVKAWEDHINRFKDLNCSVAKIRIGLVLSDQGGALPKIAGPINNYAGAAFGSGQQWQSWIHIKDLARLFVYTVEKQLKGTFNGVAPNPVTNSKLTKEVAKALKKPLFLPNIPKVFMNTILGEMAYLLFASQRVSSKRIEKKGFHFEYKNICSALESFYGEADCSKESDLTTYEKNFS